MNSSFAEADGKPGVLRHRQVNLGLAVDVKKSDGSHSLMVPNIKAADTLDFDGYFAAYEDIIRRVRSGKIGSDDFAGTTVTLTNPGTIGTVHSVPRLMPGQGAIIGVGTIDYPPSTRGPTPAPWPVSGWARSSPSRRPTTTASSRAPSRASSSATSTSSCWAPKASTTRSSPASGSRTSRPAGSATSAPTTTPRTRSTSRPAFCS